LILRKIIKIVATRCHILRLKCTKFDFGWGSAPDPTWGAYSALPDPLAAFKGPTSKGREGRGRKKRKEGRVKRKGKGSGFV